MGLRDEETKRDIERLRHEETEGDIERLRDSELLD